MLLFMTHVCHSSSFPSDLELLPTNKDTNSHFHNSFNHKVIQVILILSEEITAPSEFKIIDKIHCIYSHICLHFLAQFVTIKQAGFIIQFSPYDVKVYP